MKDFKESEIDKVNKNKNNKTIKLIFRNQLSNDTTIEINKLKIKTISDIIDLLFNEIKQNKSNCTIRLFFKGKPLKNEEKIKNLRNKK